MELKKSVLPIFIGVLLITNCGGPWIMQKAELQKWYRDDLSRYSGAGKLGYTGSDAAYHYFIARPVDDFVTIQVPRDDLTLKEERRTSELGRERMYFYLVDPARDFRRIDDKVF